MIIGMTKKFLRIEKKTLLYYFKFELERKQKSAILLYVFIKFFFSLTNYKAKCSGSLGFFQRFMGIPILFFSPLRNPYAHTQSHSHSRKPIECEEWQQFTVWIWALNARLWRDRLREPKHPSAASWTIHYGVQRSRSCIMEWSNNRKLLRNNKIYLYRWREGESVLLFTPTNDLAHQRNSFYKKKK